jgi:hypothetical protein
VTVAPEHHLVARQRRRVDHQRARQPVVNVADHRFDLALALLGGVIFGILAQIAVGACFLDRIDDLGPLELEPLQLLGQMTVAFASIGTLSLAILYLPLLPKSSAPLAIRQSVTRAILWKNQRFEAE